MPTRREKWPRREMADGVRHVWLRELCHSCAAMASESGGVALAYAFIAILGTQGLITVALRGAGVGWRRRSRARAMLVGQPVQGEPEFHADARVPQVDVEEFGDPSEAVAYGVAVHPQGCRGAIPASVQVQPGP